MGFTENSPGLDQGPDYIVRWTGSWGDISTQFYPPHHLTMGEGGSVNIVRDQRLKVIVESFVIGAAIVGVQVVLITLARSVLIGRSELPYGYDHKYTYSHLGYNLKPLDPQAAIGRVQLKRLSELGPSS